MGKKSCSVAVLLDIISGFHPEQIVKLQLHNRKYNFRLTDDQRYDLEDTACRNLRAEGRENDRTETDKDFTKLKVYPNPTNSEINVSSDEYIGKVEMYDQSGKKLLARNAHEDKAIKIILDNYPSGLYWIKIINLNGHNEFKKISIIK